MSTARTFRTADFLRAFGAPPEDAALIEGEVARHDFSYQLLEGAERDAVILQVLKKIDSFTQVGAHRHDIWDGAWSDLARRYAESGGKLEALDPPFVGATPTLRIAGDYARPTDPRFELNWLAVFRQWLFRRWLGGARRALEFGCGSGFNLVALAGLHPQIALTGLDWSEAAAALMNRIAADHRLDLRGRRFDFFAPDPSVALGPGSVAMTFCALEQTGDRFGAFLDWLVAGRPDLVINMEPAIELYDPDRLVDHLAIRYHRHRRYLDGYFSSVRALAREGRVEVLLERRLGFGSLYHEGFSLLIWRPKV